MDGQLSATNIGRFYAVMEALDSGNITAAIMLNAQIQPENVIESNRKTVNCCYLTKHTQGTLAIMSSSGQMIYKELITANQNTLIRLPNLPNGLYFCQVIADGEIISSEKLFINK